MGTSRPAKEIAYGGKTVRLTKGTSRPDKEVAYRETFDIETKAKILKSIAENCSSLPQCI